MNRDLQMARARARFEAAQRRGLAAVVEQKLTSLRSYDVAGMSQAVAICHWGRSGSLLLTSYLDGCPDIVMLPASRSQRIYEFFAKHQSLPLAEKLITYPVLSEEYGQPFFYGDFPIAETDYHAAVIAVMAVYGDRDPQWLSARRTFFQMVHVTYALALGRIPATPRPLMVYAQHNWDPLAAKTFIEDFPTGRFIHAIRNPVAGFDSWFDRILQLETDAGQFPNPGYLRTALTVASDLTSWIRPHPDMESRTRAVRFEDLHLSTPETMREVATWLGIPSEQPFCESTFNGLPFVAGRDAADWVGSLPQQVDRKLRNTSRRDAFLLGALLYEDFVAWNYPCTGIFASASVRRLVWTALRALPLKMERKAARTVFDLQALPTLRQGRPLRALRILARLLACHWDMTRLLAKELERRIGSIWGPPGRKTSPPKSFELLRPRRATSQLAMSAPALPARSPKQALDPDHLARTLLGKYCYGHSAAYCPTSRSEIEHETATVEDVGRAVSMLAPILQALRDHVFSAEKVHATDKPVRVLSSGRVTFERAWVYVRDDRPCCGAAPPAVVLFYSKDRGPQHRREHLQRFAGFLQYDVPPQLDADNAPGSGAAGPILDVACWARCRLRFCDVWGATQSDVAWAALERIAALYDIEDEARHRPPSIRVECRAAARTLIEAFFEWADAQLKRLHPASALAEAFRYTLQRRRALTLYLDHGGLEIDNDRAETVLRGIPLGERFWGFIDGASGGEHAATAYSIIGTARLNDLDPAAYLRGILPRLADANLIGGVEPLLPWNWRSKTEAAAEAPPR